MNCKLHVVPRKAGILDDYYGFQGETISRLILKWDHIAIVIYRSQLNQD